METRILLGGGGSEVDERPIFEVFAAWVSTGCVLYLPIASEPIRQSNLDWISAALNPLGIQRIEMWATLAGHAPEEVHPYQAIFIGGGNTYHLLDQLRSSGFDHSLQVFAARGGVIYGGSAGAIVLGRDISTCAHLDENTVSLADPSGLDLLNGDSVWCHYHSADDRLVQAHVERTQSPTIALAETRGVWFRGSGEYLPLGSGNLYRFTIDGKHALG